MKLSPEMFFINDNPFDLSNKTIIIIGGTSGIGLGMAYGLGKFNANVIITGRSKEKGEEAIKFLRNSNIRAEFISGSINDPESFEKLEEKINSDENSFFGIILCAASTFIHETISYPEEKMKELLDINLFSQIKMAKWACNKLIDSGGSIVFISSGSSHRSMPKNVIYASTKSALNGLCKSLAVEWAKYNIRVNVIIPGWVETTLTDFIIKDKESSNSTYEKIKNSIPQKRWGFPKDFIGISLYLMSDLSQYTTGAEFVIDGGLLIS